MKYVLFPALIIVGIYLFFVIILNSTQQEQNKNFGNLNIKLSGVIYSISRENGYNGFGIIRIKILRTNTHYYDPRDSLKFYYCIIKDSIAEVYDHAFGSTEVGDTLSIDTEKRLSWLGGNESKHDEGSISINRSEKFYDYINNTTWFKKINRK